VETYRLMLPDKDVSAIIFSSASPGDDLDRLNAYVRECSERTGFPSLVFASPEWSADRFEREIANGGFVGAKVYLSLAPAYLPRTEIRIFDFLPQHQLEVLNRRGWIVMLHIPRDARLMDPVNLAQMVEIDRRYPSAKVIIAHVGRAYCDEDAGKAFEVLAETGNLLFDIAANTNERVFRRLIRAVGADRILFGSDLPILRMRMRRVCEDGVYVNLVPKGLYGDVSGDRHMREVGAPESDRLTFFLYEQIDAFRRAAEAEGLSRDDVEKVFHGNAERIITEARGNKRSAQLCMVWPKNRLGDPPTWSLPPGYVLTTYAATYDEAYIRLMRAAGFDNWGHKNLGHVLARCLPGGLFFIVHEATGALVGTACAIHNPTAHHPFGAEVGWVAVDPAHRGKGLGYAVTAAATRRLREAGYEQIYLLTDDWRLPALRTYLRLGFVPFLFQPNMAKRWRAVCDRLGVDFTVAESG